MDFNVYFTICPHCGFSYRIQVTPDVHSCDVGLGTIAIAALALCISAVTILVAAWVFLD